MVPRLGPVKPGFEGLCTFKDKLSYSSVAKNLKLSSITCEKLVRQTKGLLSLVNKDLKW